MANEGQYPKIDGDVFYGKDANMSYYNGTLSSTLNHASINVGTSATAIKAANTSRQSILIKNTGTATVYLGPSGVTTGDGYLLAYGKSIILYHKEAIYGITASTTEDVRYLEAEQ